MLAAPVREVTAEMADHSERFFDLRATWVDLDNGRETRSSTVLAAWREQDLDLVSNRDPIPLPAEQADDVCPDTDIFAFCVTPEWLARRGGLPAYMDSVFHKAEYRLWRLQRDRALETHASGRQLTLEAIPDGGQVEECPERTCPACGVPMDCTDTGYVYLWDCENEACGNADGYWRIYDWDVFGQVKRVQEEVGQAAAERLAGEFKDGVLA